jgi:hypothetical protein
MGGGTALTYLYLTAASGGIPQEFLWQRPNFVAYPSIWIALEVTWVILYLTLVVAIGIRPGWVMLTALFSLLAIPFVWVGTADEFARRASIPALLILCLLVLRAVIAPPPMKDDRSKRTMRFRRIMTASLCGALAVGALTPIIEFKTRANPHSYQNSLAIVPSCSLLEPSCRETKKTLLDQYLAPASNGEIKLLLR